MSVLVVLLLLALLFAGIGLLVEAAGWALIVALVLVVAGVFVGLVGKDRSTIA